MGDPFELEDDDLLTDEVPDIFEDDVSEVDVWADPAPPQDPPYRLYPDR